MTIEDQIRGEKLQYDINREPAKISALSSGKIYKYEYLTGEETLPSNQQQIIQQAKFTYSPLGKAFQEQTKTIKEQGEKQIKAIQDKRPIKSIEKFTYDINMSNSKIRENTYILKYFYLISKIGDGEISLSEAKDEQVKLI